MSERTYAGFTITELRGFQENLKLVVGSKSGAELALGDLLDHVIELEATVEQFRALSESSAVAMLVQARERIAALEAELTNLIEVYWKAR